MVGAFSFCLYGSNAPGREHYYIGMLENIELVRVHFPGWVLYVYVGNDVDAEFVKKMAAHPFVRIRFTNVVGPVNMVHRFFAIDELDVSIMFSRDADSRIHWKDRWAIREFAKSSFAFHAIRDHPNHKARIMGGMWGIRKPNISIRVLYEQYAANPIWADVDGIDQKFLMTRLYPIVKDTMLLHYSCGRQYSDEKGVPFPFIYNEQFHVGQREYGSAPDPPAQPIVRRMFPFLKTDLYS